MMDLIRLAARGWLIVSLVASNTVLLAHGEYLWAGAGGWLISAVWWSNAQRAAREPGWRPLVAYATGGLLGTWTGLAVGQWLSS